jgi:bilirubin oxidase
MGGMMRRSPTGAGMGGMMRRSPTTGSIWPTGLPLRRLGILEDTSPAVGEFEGTLAAAPHLASLVSGHTTELWGYNNAYPGPVIELREGQRVTIDFANRLGLESTIHWHGLAVPVDQDGSPMDPVAPGANRLYTFDVPMGSAGTYWYHPHAHQTTTLQVGHGLVVHLGGDPAVHTAIGMGCGLERLAMLRYGIDDARKVESARVA